MNEGGAQDGGFRFGIYEIRLHSHELLKEGVRIRLQEKPFQVLGLLVEKAGTTVTRDEFRHRLWSADTHVEFDANLNAALAKVRQALEESAENPRFIETVSRLGYRFTADVYPLANGGAWAPAESLPPVRKKENEETAGGAGVGLKQAAPPLPAWFRRALLSVALLIAVALPCSFVFRGFASRLGLQPAGRAVLVVLPFTDLSNDSKEELFSDGLTDELITRIGSLNPEKLGVIARTSAMHYKGTRETVQQIGKELGADYALEGTVRRSGGHVQVTAQLAQTRGQTRLWAQTYASTNEDLSQLQGEVAGSVASALAAALVPAAREEAKERRRIVNEEAYEHYMEARLYWNSRTRDGMLRAEKLYSRALQRDPQFELGYAGLAEVYLTLADWEVLPPGEAFPRAREAAGRALALNDSLGGAHAVLAAVSWLSDWNWSKAETEFRQATSLDPANATARQWYAEYLCSMGRDEEAVAEMMRARETDPLSMIIQAAVGNLHYNARRFDQAIEASKRAIQADPAFPPPYLYLSRSYLALGKYRESLEMELKYMELNGATEASRAALRHAFQAGGIQASWRWELDDLRQREAREYVSPFRKALLESRLGDRHAALADLEKSYATGDGNLVWIKVDAALDSLRDEPQFKTLLAKLHLDS
jgi:TolB-like protein/DNA-binding winged helix-turn-helix (wHTH) protein/thioredoxin-like negative regulator of GroEL